MFIIRHLKPLLVLLSFVILLPAALTANGNSQAPENLHESFDRLLQTYVKGTRFDYEALFNNKEDLQQLSDYVDLLEKQNPAGWARNDALAFWINLYNAATLELVLKHYPLNSIKDIGGIFSSPWKREVVTVAGRRLNLDEIENDIIRKEFGDARIHFAVNCAAIGCPPLSNRAFVGESLDAQLEDVTRSTLNNPQWVNITDSQLRITKIFDWYKSDFETETGTVRAFIAKYRPADAEKVLNDTRALKIMDYDWRLNQIEKN